MSASPLTRKHLSHRKKSFLPQQWDMTLTYSYDPLVTDPHAKLFSSEFKEPLVSTAEVLQGKWKAKGGRKDKEIKKKLVP